MIFFRKDDYYSRAFFRFIEAVSNNWVRPFEILRSYVNGVDGSDVEINTSNTLTHVICFSEFQEHLHLPVSEYPGLQRSFS